MSTLSIAKKYVELCKKNDHDTILDTLFSPDVVSVEAAPMPGGSAESRGIAAVKEKGKRWSESHIVHEAHVDGPWPKGDQFIVRFSYDVTNKPANRRIKMEEAALLTVENDKITREEFFYSTEA